MFGLVYSEFWCLGLSVLWFCFMIVVLRLCGDVFYVYFMGLWFLFYVLGLLSITFEFVVWVCVVFGFYCSSLQFSFLFKSNFRLCELVFAVSGLVLGFGLFVLFSGICIIPVLIAAVVLYLMWTSDLAFELWLAVGLVVGVSLTICCG